MMTREQAIAEVKAIKELINISFAAGQTVSDNTWAKVNKLMTEYHIELSELA